MPLPDPQNGRLTNTDERPTEAMDAFLAQLSPRDVQRLQDRLFDHLSPWDLIHLRTRIRNTAIIGLQTLEDLPLDLVCLIAEYLNPKELLVATQVNKQWRKLFASRVVLNMACSLLYPGLRESQPERAETDLLGLFRNTLRLYSKRSAGGPYLSQWGPGWRTCGSTYARWVDGIGKPETMYSDGRLAYQVEHQTKVVDVRNGSTRSIVAPVDRRKAVREQVVAMSKHLLVLAQSQMDRPNQWRVL